MGDPMSESEIMSKNSTTQAARIAWAMKGSEDDFERRKSENKNPAVEIVKNNNVFHRRMGGCSDTENKVIGPDWKDIPK